MRVIEWDVLNIDRPPCRGMPATTHNQLNRGRARKDAQALDERAVGRARQLAAGQACTYNRIAAAAHHSAGRPAEQPGRLPVAADHHPVLIDHEGWVSNRIHVHDIGARGKVERAHASTVGRHDRIEQGRKAR